jgi:hypothetical protein
MLPTFTLYINDQRWMSQSIRQLVAKNKNLPDLVVNSSSTALDVGLFESLTTATTGDKWTLAMKCHAMKARATPFSSLVGLTWPNNLAPENVLNLAQQQSHPIGLSCIQFSAYPFILYYSTGRSSLLYRTLLETAFYCCGYIYYYLGETAYSSNAGHGNLIRPRK